MKITNKSGIAASLILTAMLSSCSDKGYWDEAPREQGYSFGCKQYSQSLLEGADEVTLTLYRSINTSQESVNVTFTPGKDCPSDITVESPVTFEAGSNKAEFKVKIADGHPPYTYNGTLAFNGNVSYSGNANCTLTLPVSYTYEPAGTGLFYDAWVMDNAEDYYEVEFLKAKGFERYRVLNPYKEYMETIAAASWEDWVASTGTDYIEFWELEDGTLTYDPWYTGLDYLGVPTQPINMYAYNAKAVVDMGMGGSPGHDVWYEPGYALLSPVVAIPGLGGFGQPGYTIEIIVPSYFAE